MSRTRVGVLISGRGSNMEALARAAREPDCPFEIALVISNNPNAPGLEIARGLGVEAHCLDHRLYPHDRRDHEHALDAVFRAAGCEWIALAGYMRILTPVLVNAWGGRMVNIHPSLLPLFTGLHPQAQALNAGVKLSGASVHLVIEGVDEGPILGQVAVPVLEGDTPETLGERILTQEHRLYPAVLARLVSGGGSATDPNSALLNV